MSHDPSIRALGIVDAGFCKDLLYHLRLATPGQLLPTGHCCASAGEFLFWVLGFRFGLRWFTV